MPEMSSVIHLGAQSKLQRFSMFASDVLCYTSRGTVYIAKVLHVCHRSVPEMSSVIHLG